MSLSRSSLDLCCRGPWLPDNPSRIRIDVTGEPRYASFLPFWSRTRKKTCSTKQQARCFSRNTTCPIVAKVNSKIENDVVWLTPKLDQWREQRAPGSLCNSSGRGPFQLAHTSNRSCRRCRRRRYGCTVQEVLLFKAFQLRCLKNIIIYKEKTE